MSNSMLVFFTQQMTGPYILIWGGGLAEDKAGDSDLRNMYGLFFPH